MGTSASVTGAGPGSPLIPDWVHDVPEEVDSADNEDEGLEIEAPSSVLARNGRLSAARRSLGEFASSGDSRSMRRGIGHYVRSGRGGAGMASRRSAGSARRAAVLDGLVSGSAALEIARDRIREAFSAQGSARELLAAIAAAASPIDGTLDSETGQSSASEALQYVLERFPNADLLALDRNQREILMERFLALDCFALFYTETGKHFQGKCDLLSAASRIDEIKNYFCETFRQANEGRRASGERSFGGLSDRQVAAECHKVISEAYIIFEAYLDEG